jgi:hypothetical protein
MFATEPFELKWYNGHIPELTYDDDYSQIPAVDYLRMGHPLLMYLFPIYILNAPIEG